MCHRGVFLEIPRDTTRTAGSTWFRSLLPFPKKKREEREGTGHFWVLAVQWSDAEIIIARKRLSVKSLSSAQRIKWAKISRNFSVGDWKAICERERHSVKWWWQRKKNCSIYARKLKAIQPQNRWACSAIAIRVIWKFRATILLQGVCLLRRR